MAMDDGSDDRIEDMERRVERLEAREGAMDRSRRMAQSVVPEETRQHLKAAGREQLLAMRSLLDHWIGRLRDEPADEKPTRETIKIE